ncbi:hypothetical protein GXY_07175, partial [Novacetimonas hansenii ATCC 23769]
SGRAAIIPPIILDQNFWPGWLLLLLALLRKFRLTLRLTFLCQSRMKCVDAVSC